MSERGLRGPNRRFEGDSSTEADAQAAAGREPRAEESCQTKRRRRRREGRAAPLRCAEEHRSRKQSAPQRAPCLVDEKALGVLHAEVAEAALVVLHGDAGVVDVVVALACERGGGFVGWRVHRELCVLSWRQRGRAKAECKCDGGVANNGIGALTNHAEKEQKIATERACSRGGAPHPACRPCAGRSPPRRRGARRRA